MNKVQIDLSDDETFKLAGSIKHAELRSTLRGLVLTYFHVPSMILPIFTSMTDVAKRNNALQLSEMRQVNTYKCFRHLEDVPEEVQSILPLFQDSSFAGYLVCIETEQERLN